MDIRQLQYLVALAREKHFTRAASACHVTQPTLSGRIRQLELELGVPIVERGQRYQGLTQEGARVLKWAQLILNNWASMHQELAHLATSDFGLTGRLTLGAIPSALPMIPYLTQAVRKLHPHIDFTVMSLSSEEILRGLDDYSLDAGITYLDNEPLGRVTSVPLYDERYQLITAVGNPYSDRDKVTWAELSQLPLCLLTPDMQNRRIIDQHLAEAGVQVRPTLESNSMIVLFSHIRTGKWSSIMPLNLAETFGFSEPIRAIPIVEPDASHTVGLVAAPREPHTPLVQALLDEAMALADDFRAHR